jgi:hypothetical protein
VAGLMMVCDGEVEGGGDGEAGTGVAVVSGVSRMVRSRTVRSGPDWTSRATPWTD